MQVEADSLQVNQTTGEATFTGNVVIGQGEMRLLADSVTVIYAEGGRNRIRSLDATGNVTLVSGADAAEASCDGGVYGGDLGRTDDGRGGSGAAARRVR